MSSFRSNAGPDAAYISEVLRINSYDLTPISSITARSYQKQRLNHDTLQKRKTQKVSPLREYIRTNFKSSDRSPIPVAQPQQG